MQLEEFVRAMMKVGPKGALATQISVISRNQVPCSRRPPAARILVRRVLLAAWSDPSGGLTSDPCAPHRTHGGSQHGRHCRRLPLAACRRRCCRWHSRCG